MLLVLYTFMITENCNNDIHGLCHKPVSCECKCHKRRMNYRVGGDQ